MAFQPKWEAGWSMYDRVSMCYVCGCAKVFFVRNGNLSLVTQCIDKTDHMTCETNTV